MAWERERVKEEEGVDGGDEGGEGDDGDGDGDDGEGDGEDGEGDGDEGEVRDASDIDGAPGPFPPSPSPPHSTAAVTFDKTASTTSAAVDASPTTSRLPSNPTGGPTTSTAARGTGRPHTYPSIDKETYEGRGMGREEVVGGRMHRAKVTE